MPAPRFPRVVALALTGFLAVTPTARSAAHPVDPPRSVRFLGEAVVPNGLVFAGTTVGGLSGVDRDPRTGGYVFISDDRSNTGPARFYTAAFTVGVNGVGPVTFTGT
ncbi:MAG TPA: esterase-like activity of phytase family protein, partial [Umezawaea sp.]|nr:esterase-like activity of phytase family protein [Umezawaea sp.]